MQKLLTASRYFMVLPVIGSIIAAIFVLVYGTLDVAALIFENVTHWSFDTETSESLVLGFIKIIDLYLLGTVFYIIGLGLYELFVDDQVEMPDWLHIRSLDDLKEKLIAVIIVVMAVSFLGQVSKWKGALSNPVDILYLSLSIAAMILALTFFISKKKDKA